MDAPTLVVLAAGMGSRYGGLKQMDAFGPYGENIIDYSIYDAIAAGFDKVVFVIREQFRDAFVEFFSGKFEDKIAVEYVAQELGMLPEGYAVPEGREKPWGTGHAVWITRHVVDGPFAVINADDFYGRDAYIAIRDFFTGEDAAAGNYCVVGYYLRNTLSEHGAVNRGVCHVDDAMYLRGVDEIVGIRRDTQGMIRYPPAGVLDENTIVSMNIWGFLPSWYQHSEQCFRDFLDGRHDLVKAELYIPAIADVLIRNDTLKIKVLTCDASWFGVTYKEDKPHVQQRLNALIAAGEYPEDLWG